MTRTRRGAALVALGMLASLAVGCGLSEGDADEVRDTLDSVDTLVRTTSLSLPSVPVEIGEDGRVTKVGGLEADKVDDFFSYLTGSTLIGRIRYVEPEYLEWFKRTNVQHITVAARPEGLYVLVNGRALPYVAWDDERLDNLVDVLGMLQKDGEGTFVWPAGETADAVRHAIPLLRRLGPRVELRFPRRPGVRAIPSPREEAFEVYVTDEELDADPLQQVDLVIDYHPLPGEGGWVPSILGFSTVDLNRLGDPLDLDLPRMRMGEDLRRRLAAEGIESVGVESRADGLYVTVDGLLMPNLSWNEDTLRNLSAVLDQLYPPGTELPEDARFVPLIRATAPMYNDFAVALLFRFPVE